MGLQLIFCVETNKKTQSDVIYIKQTISQFYNLNNAHQKLSWVFMDGKLEITSGRIPGDGSMVPWFEKAPKKRRSRSNVIGASFDGDGLWLY